MTDVRRVAVSSIRFELTWIALGQAAGGAAHLAVEGGVQPQDAPAPELQKMFQHQGLLIHLGVAPR